MSYEFEIKKLEPVTAATVHYRGKYSDAAKYFPSIFKAVKGKSCGAPFCIYYNHDEEAQTADVEVCVPTQETVNGASIKIKEIPCARALCTVHCGNYESLIKAYDALRKQIDENNLNAKLSCRETYIKGPGMIFKGNPDNYITEVAIYLEDENEQL